ncbi:MAG: hypothetical protein JWN68_854 [Nocardioides sp.]|jgi:hypothetical protein|nr:hypothetical protein [Nocardioides sp.]MCW2832901.1 hypothetical protein [Nocardioides sp.]
MISQWDDGDPEVRRIVRMTVMGKPYFDKVIGQDLEKGLAAIKALAEGS